MRARATIGRMLPRAVKDRLRSVVGPPAPPTPSPKPPVDRMTFRLDDTVAVVEVSRRRRGHRLTGLVLRLRESEGRLREVEGEHRVDFVAPESGRARTARMDLRDLARAAQIDGASADFYLEWTSTKGVAAGAPLPDDAHRRTQRLGHFDDTRIPTTVQRTRVGEVDVLLEMTLEGNLSVRFNDQRAHTVKSEVIGLVRHQTMTSISYTVTTFNRPIEGAVLTVRGRQTQAQQDLPVQVEHLDSATRADWGRRVYRVSADIDFAAIAQQQPDADEMLDLSVELTLEGVDDPVRLGLTLPEGLEEHRLRSTPIHRDGQTHLFVPYLTFRKQRLTYRVERFATADYRFMRRLLAVSWAFPVIKPFTRIWLVGEVPYKAQDNGYHFFRHVRSHHPRRRVYFVIDASSPDRARLAELGNVVDRFSRRHVLYSLLASRLVGSHHAEYLFVSRDRPVARRIRGVRIFLQHGITASKNVVPNYARQGTFELPTERFIVASELEQKIVMEDYGYRRSQVPVAGFARFDALFAAADDPSPTILVMPTWRDSLVRTEAFLGSDYYENWHGFLAGAELQSLLADSGMTVTFVLHPNMRMFAGYFDLPHVRVVRQEDADVQRLLSESSVLVTDFSSVAWDFSFQQRPVLYFQFDQRKLVDVRSPHIDPFTQLPGPIARTPTELARELRSVVESGCAMAPEYWERSRAFLTYRDQQNCARIYDVVRRSWTVDTAVHRLRNARWIQRRWWTFRRGPTYFVWMERLFRVGRLLPRKDSVVFECDRGANFGDAPRYLYEKLIQRPHSLTIYWANNTTLRLPDPRTTKVARHSPRYYWELSRARYWVNNQNFPAPLAKPSSTRFLQTWHGTPLKRMQHDVEVMAGRDDEYEARAARLTSYWDALLAGSSYAAACFRSAFRYEGPVLELGYPRNDLFSWPDAEKRRRLVRQRLGLSDDPRKVILYAPTFRDDNRPGINWKHQLELDIERMSAELSDDFVLVVRFHQLVRQSLRGVNSVDPTFLIDGSKYPDIQELLLATDVLITDYSSVFFDFAALQRPILFYTYDLDRYRDVLRGFYLDFETVAPGPLLTDNDSVLAALHDIEDVTTRYADKLREFSAEYGPRDDGGASDRVLDTFFGAAAGRGPSSA